MALKINHNLVNEEIARQLIEICPFKAIEFNNSKLSINAACKNCRICVKKGPAGVIEEVKEEVNTIDKEQWKNIVVYAIIEENEVHPVTYELIGKARELTKVINHEVHVLAIGYNLSKIVDKILHYGAGKVFIYDHEKLEHFDVERYTNVFEDFINKNKPSSILFGATNIGRSLAPRVAARFRTGLTADCTALEMKENTDLVQIRPAFGGNIMAQIINPNHRPQFCTARYKIFNAPEKVSKPTGEIINCPVEEKWLSSNVEILEIINKKKEEDISESEIIVAVGRGLKSKDDLELVYELAELLNASVGCTRPLVETGLLDNKHQIGLSGKTVKPKLIITLGISGSIQFVSGMKNAECIIAVNNNPSAQIFDIAHYGVFGDIYEVVPELIKIIKEAKSDV
jgi:electron transfer flavoprotein alpha subunit